MLYNNNKTARKNDLIVYKPLTGPMVAGEVLVLGVAPGVLSMRPVYLADPINAVANLCLLQSDLPFVVPNNS